MPRTQHLIVSGTDQDRRDAASEMWSKNAAYTLTSQDKDHEAPYRSTRLDACKSRMKAFAIVKMFCLLRPSLQKHQFDCTFDSNCSWKRLVVQLLVQTKRKYLILIGLMIQLIESRTQLCLIEGISLFQTRISENNDRFLFYSTFASMYSTLDLFRFESNHLIGWNCFYKHCLNSTFASSGF